MKLKTDRLDVFQWVFVVAFVLIPSLILAQQDKKPIHLLDATTHDPIVGAAYQYGIEKGISDADGLVEITFQKGEILYLSHISYGQWQLGEDLVKQALNNGAIQKDVASLNMQPVTIIGIKPKPNETEKLFINQPDRLAHDAGSLLSRNAAISGIRKSGSYGFDPVMRGFKYDQLNVVIDGGQSATAACPNRMDPPTSQVSVNMMDRVEIMKGPHSLRYGSAFGGTINYISIQPKFSTDRSVYGRASTTYESNGGIMRGEGKLGFNNQKYDATVYGSWSQGNDYTDGEGIKTPSSFLRGSFGANLAIAVTSNQTVVASATRNIARDTDFPALQMDLRSDDTWLFNARHEMTFKGKLLKSWNTSFYATQVNHVMDNLSKELQPRMLNAVTKATTQNYGGRTEGTWRYSKGLLHAGVDLRAEHAEGKRTRTFLMGPMAGNTVIDNVWQNSEVSKTGIFGEYSLPFRTFNFVFSGRMELNNASANELETKFSNVYQETTITQLNPSLSVGGINNFRNGTSIGLWYGRAQRSGSITERYINYLPVGLDPYEMIGNPDLKAEVNNQVDLTLGYKTSSTVLNLSVFTSLLQDYISSEIDTTLTPAMPSSPGVRRFINIDNALMAGFEFSWNQRLFAGLSHQFSVAYTYGQNKVLNQPLPEIAPLDMQYTLSGSYLKGKLTPEVTLRHVLTQDRISPEFGETQTPAFTLVDASIAYKVNKLFSATIGAQNIFDVPYYEHLSRSVLGTNPRPIYAPGRNIFISLLVDFK